MPHRESRQEYNKPHRSSFPLSVCSCLILHCFLHQHARSTPTCYSRLHCSMSICAPWSCAYVVTVSQQAIHHVVKPQQEGYRAFGLGSSFNPHYPSITCTLLVACAGRDLPTSHPRKMFHPCARTGVKTHARWPVKTMSVVGYMLDYQEAVFQWLNLTFLFTIGGLKSKGSIYQVCK